MERIKKLIGDIVVEAMVLSLYVLFPLATIGGMTVGFIQKTFKRQ